MLQAEPITIVEWLAGWVGGSRGWRESFKSPVVGRSLGARTTMREEAPRTNKWKQQSPQQRHRNSVGGFIRERGSLLLVREAEPGTLGP